MLKSRRRHIAALILAVIVLTLSLALLASPACANPGLSLSGAMLVTDVSPGQTLTHKMKISFGENDTAKDMVVQVTGIMQSLDGVNDFWRLPRILAPIQLARLSPSIKAHSILSPALRRR